MNPSVDTCVIGSGYGGLSIARALDVAGADYVVLDKGRTPGGRAATRRFSGSRFDHGLPLLTDQGPLSWELIERGCRGGVLDRLDPAEAGCEGWFAKAGISALGKHLASDLNVRNQVRVTRVREADGGLILETDEAGQTGMVEVRRELHVTAPLPQAMELVAPLDPDWDLPEGSPFHKAVVAMVKPDPGLLPDGPFFRPLESGKGSLVLENLKFPDVEPGVSLRFSPDESERIFDLGDDATFEIVSGELEPLTGPVPSDRIQLMRWRYANGSGLVPVPFLETTSGRVRVTVCGDAFFGGTASGVEASLMSCRAALIH